MIMENQETVMEMSLKKMQSLWEPCEPLELSRDTSVKLTVTSLAVLLLAWDTIVIIWIYRINYCRRMNGEML